MKDAPAFSKIAESKVDLRSEKAVLHRREKKEIGLALLVFGLAYILCCML